MASSDSHTFAGRKEVRAHETRAEIDAPVEEVWKALTVGEDVARWFAPKVTVTPGAGGSMVAEFAKGLEWKTAIEVWEPNKHLRLVETRDEVMGADPVKEPLEPCRLVQDYYLEARGGKTVLRLVHSGFGNSDAWDIEYEGTQGGWGHMFVRLKSLLEGHRNDSVHNVLLTTPCYGVESAEAFRRIRAEAERHLELKLLGHGHLCGALPENGSLVTASVQPSAMGCVAYLELLLFGVSEARAKVLEEEWRSRIAGLFRAGAAA